MHEERKGRNQTPQTRLFSLSVQKKLYPITLIREENYIYEEPALNFTLMQLHKKDSFPCRKYSMMILILRCTDYKLHHKIDIMDNRSSQIRFHPLLSTSAKRENVEKAMFLVH